MSNFERSNPLAHEVIRHRHMPNTGSLCSILRITEYGSIFVEHLIYLFWSIAGEYGENQGLKLANIKNPGFFFIFLTFLIRDQGRV